MSNPLPAGFRFHPTDEELIIHYLQNQVTALPCPVVSIIPEVDIYKFDPWQLPDKAGVGENEWYFFTPRDRKYPNGVRPNRAAVSGYWKATGTDKAIYSGSKYVGIKKSLVFYLGKPPKGVKTDWIMHEYRLSESRAQPYKQNGSMRLDEWVLCRIYKKKTMARTETSCDDRLLQQTLGQQHLLASSSFSVQTAAKHNYSADDSITHRFDSNLFSSHDDAPTMNYHNNLQDHSSTTIKMEGFFEDEKHHLQHDQLGFLNISRQYI